MHPELQKWVVENAARVDTEGEGSSFTVHQLEPKIRHEDKKNKVRVLTIGPENDREVKAMLLLGETGNGKSFFCNAFVNRVFGVGKEDSIRLRLKDQMDKADKRSIYSQTEYMSAYVIYHQNGMPHEYNYMIIDTPGFGDTGGRCRDEVNEACLRFYLTDESWIKHLNSVAIVWKASDLRYNERKREILCKIRDLLDFDVRPITDIIMTFSTGENEKALEVVKEAKIDYQGVFHFDNGPLYSTCPEDSRKQTSVYQWRDMEDEHERLLDSLDKREAVHLKITERLFLSQLIREDRHGRRKKELNGVDWGSVKGLEISKDKILLDDGKHSHYCLKCQTVCTSECTSDHETPSWKPKVELMASVLPLLEIPRPVRNVAKRIRPIVKKYPLQFGVAAGVAAGIVLAVGAILYFRSKETDKLHSAEGNNRCPQCNHLGKHHEIREKCISKDADFDITMELLKRDRYQTVMGKRADTEAEMQDLMGRLKDSELNH
ncbi:uncharacterized protein LOC122267345 [Penaeus japonicus]|uniref:uncharacterized protein LOC122267345 n=1 Tax=Penaeus japonicus TaxID=27405 RepID=UPI001C713D3D|nr:uncharacterized protein LOC122267345 [Penaeus japonicus]